MHLSLDEDGFISRYCFLSSLLNSLWKTSWFKMHCYNCQRKESVQVHTDCCFYDFPYGEGNLQKIDANESSNYKLVILLFEFLGEVVRHNAARVHHPYQSGLEGVFIAVLHRKFNSSYISYVVVSFDLLYSPSEMNGWSFSLNLATLSHLHKQYITNAWFTFILS